jgi:alpha-1,6-mannosyltransferase
MDRYVRRLIAYGGGAALLAFVTLAVTQAPLGTPLFFACAAVPCAVYALLLFQLLGESSPVPNRRLLIAAMLLAVAFRVPLAVARVGSDSDMVRYLYDGRLQRLGYNPFSVLPSDPALAATHTDDTRRMPSRNAMTPYPAAAQLFFRLIVSIRESRRLMKLALVGCDLLTIAVLVAWLRSTERSPWLALVYAWNPLVVLEVAHSGHIDALGALWLATSAWMLSTGRGMRAMVAFVIAVATKLLPIVLLPLYWRRVRIRDAVVGALVLAALYFPFRSAGTLALGAVPNVIEYIRFNGPLFKRLASFVTPQGAAAVAVLAGLTLAAWFRARRSADDPAAWAWPMAISLAAAPVVYPWYLLCLTPFLFTRASLPLIAWTYTVLPVYLVWQLSREGGRWKVPPVVMAVEYGAVAMLVALVLYRAKGANGANGANGAAGAKGAGAKGAEGANGAGGEGVEDAKRAEPA